MADIFPVLPNFGRLELIIHLHSTITTVELLPVVAAGNEVSCRGLLSAGRATGVVGRSTRSMTLLTALARLRR